LKSGAQKRKEQAQQKIQSSAAKQARSHGGYSGAVPPNYFCAPPN